MSAAPQTTDPLESTRPVAAIDHEVVIIGSGFSGLGAAVALQKMGIQDFVILEREEQLGGTWVQHDYPGLEVDMPFFIYSFPFEMKPDWSQVYPTGQEMKEYTLHCAREYDLVRRTRCETTVERAEYDADANVWRVETLGGEAIVTRYLVNATGLLVIPKMPDIEGIDDFEGKIIHTARWDYDYDLTDKRVAVIGTGATAIQLIPAIVDRVEQLAVRLAHFGLLLDGASHLGHLCVGQLTVDIGGEPIAGEELIHGYSLTSSLPMRFRRTRASSVRAR